MKDKIIRFIAMLLLSALASLLIYIILHETGHMIVMLSAGARITEFSILPAHVSSDGGRYTDFSDLWMNANGMFLPYVTACLCGLLYNRGRKNRFYRFFFFFFSVISFMPLTAWAVIPLIYVPGSEPGGEDVTKFLYNFTTDHSPLLVSAAALLLFAIGLVIMLRKGIIRNYISEIRSAKQS